MFAEWTLKDYLDRLASGEPTPGGGAAAAITGAQGAALVSMVCHLTIGKPRFATVEATLKEVLQRSEALREELLALADADAEAFGRVSAAYRLPKATPEEKTARRVALQEALKAAAQVPLQVMEACLEVMRLAVIAAEKGNPNVVSDASVAGILAHAGLLGAGDNVNVNLKYIKDDVFVRDKGAQLDTLLRAAQEVREALENALTSRQQ